MCIRPVSQLLGRFEVYPICLCVVKVSGNGTDYEALVTLSPQVQAEDPGDQEVYRHLDREGIPGEAGRPEGHVQLPGLNTFRTIS